MKYSPWGKVQSKDKYGTGIYRVHTAGHGGFMISWGVALRKLTIEARDLGARWGVGNGYLCYEEDCAAAIVLNELAETRQVADLTAVKETLAKYYPTYFAQTQKQPDVVEAPSAVASDQVDAARA